MMPFDRSRYPADWEAITARIRERAGNACEWPGCGVANGRVIHRNPLWLERWWYCRGIVCESRLPEVRVVLTVAHLDEGGPLDCPDNRLMALCQLHHLRLDAKLHARNAAGTRRRKRAAAGQLVLS